MDDEPIYVPRSTMVDIIYRGDDEFLAHRNSGEELIELPSGARQRKSRIFDCDSLNFSRMSSEGSEVRRRAGVAAPKETRTASATPKPVEADPEPVLQPVSLLVTGGNKAVGLLVMLYLAYRL